MHSQVALLLQDAFLQVENFSIPGIGSFVQRTKPDLGVEIIFDEDIEKAPSLAAFWQKQGDIPAAEAEKRLSELRVALRWALKTNGHFLIPGVGALHQYQGGKLQFHSLTPQPSDVEEASDPEPVMTPPEVPLVGADKKMGNRMISYVMIGAFGLAGLLILAQGLWGNPAEKAAQHGDSLQQTAQQVGEEAKAPQMEKAASHRLAIARVDSPLRVDRSKIVSTSRPQDREIAANQLQTAAPASRISAREQTPATPALRGSQNEATADIAVLDTQASNTSGSPASRISQVRPAPGESRFHLIAGSFANYQAARDFVAEMAEQGSQGIILPANEQTHMQYRVSIFHHANREEVVRHKQSLVEAGKKAGWIFSPPSQEASF